MTDRIEADSERTMNAAEAFNVLEVLWRKKLEELGRAARMRAERWLAGDRTMSRAEHDKIVDQLTMEADALAYALDVLRSMN